MPAPDHLVPILARLGDGGTVAQAELVLRLADEMTAAKTPPDIAELETLRAQVDAVTSQNAAILATLEDTLAAIGVPPGDAPVTVARETLLDQAADLADLRAASAAAPTIHDLIEASSLGEPDAAAARARVPLEVGEAVARRARGLAEREHDPATGGPLPPLPAEAYPDDSQPIPGADDIDWDDDPASGLDEFAADTTSNPGPVTETPPAAARPEPTNDEIRAWCVANKVPVNAKGPVSRRARAAYNDAHPAGQA